MLQKLERRFGRFAIPNLMRYVIIMYVIGFVIEFINPTFYYLWLSFDIDAILSGQVWRIVTFLVQPMEDSVFFMILMCYVYYSIGTNLEHIWGTFRFNLYYFMGILCNILATIIIYVITKVFWGYGLSVPVSLSYLNMSMLLALAVTFPNLEFLFMFLIPIKAKYLYIGYILYLAYKIIEAFSVNVFSGLVVLICSVVSLLNFIIYYCMTKQYLSPKNIKRKVDFRRSYTEGMRYSKQQSVVDPSTGAKIITRHKCAVCGKTELDGENLEFRFCSRCNGNYEYCQDHLFTHEHFQ